MARGSVVERADPRPLQIDQIVDDAFLRRSAEDLDLFGWMPIDVQATLLPEDFGSFNSL